MSACALFKLTSYIDITIFGRKLIMDSDGFTGIILILVLILYKAFCTVCETAVTEIDDRKVKNSADKIRGKATLLKLLEKPSRLVTAFAVNRVTTAIGISWLALICFDDALTTAIYDLGGGRISSADYIIAAVSYTHLTLPTMAVV